MAEPGKGPTRPGPPFLEMLKCDSFFFKISFMTMGEGCCWYSGSARVSHHCDWGSIPAPYRHLIKVTLVTCEKSVV